MSGATEPGHELIRPAARSLIDFERLFEKLPSPHMVIDRDFRYVAANAVYCATVGRTRDELIGQRVFDVFPNEGPEGARLRQSFERVIATGEPDVIALIPYPLARPDGQMELRYWSAAHAPLGDDQGRPAFVLQNTFDVTELQRLKTIAYGPGAELKEGEKELLLRTQQVEAANRALSEETQGLRDLFMQAPGFMAVVAGESLTFTQTNTAYQQLIGNRQIIGKTVAEALPEVVEQGFVDLLRHVMRSGQPFIGQAVRVLLRQAQDAAPDERFLDFIYQPITSKTGETWGVFVQGSDVTNRVRAEQQQRLLLDELNHRVKNTLATVQAIAAQTLRATPEPKAFRKTFEARIMALSSTHDLLTATSWRSASLRDLIDGELRPYGPARFTLSGPDVYLSPPQALSLGLVMHELTTNAAKYGALSTPIGEVEVTWRLTPSEEGERLVIEWAERGGPTIGAPDRRGFGSRLIETSLRSLAGSARIEFVPTGLRCTLDLLFADDVGAA